MIAKPSSRAPALARPCTRAAPVGVDVAHDGVEGLRPERLLRAVRRLQRAAGRIDEVDARRRHLVGDLRIGELREERERAAARGALAPRPSRCRRGARRTTRRCPSTSGTKPGARARLRRSPRSVERPVGSARRGGRERRAGRARRPRAGGGASRHPARRAAAVRRARAADRVAVRARSPAPRRAPRPRPRARRSRSRGPGSPGRCCRTASRRRRSARPGAAPASTAPRSVTASRVTRRPATAPVSSPPCDACSHSSQNSAQRATASTLASALPGPVGAEHVQVQAGPQVADLDDRLVARA